MENIQILVKNMREKNIVLQNLNNIARTNISLEHNNLYIYLTANNIIMNPIKILI